MGGEHAYTTAKNVTSLDALGLKSGNDDVVKHVNSGGNGYDFSVSVKSGGT